MKPLIINFGSINIDYVYRVPHFVEPGETLSSRELTVGLGGKGANQSVAIARAGVAVSHFGRLSATDGWAVELLQSAGVDTQYIEIVEEPSGHAIIQLDDHGENAIVLYGGANQSFQRPALEEVLGREPQADYLLLQNECNLLTDAFELARDRQLKIAFNPAPMTSDVKSLPLELIDTLIVNQGEAEALSGVSELDAMIRELKALLPDTRVVITLGGDGALMLSQGEVVEATTPEVAVVDTTGAGDTFVGYFLAGLVDGISDKDSLHRACAAASMAVTKKGAIASIPDISDLDF